VQAVTDCPWVLLNVERWLASPLQRQDGTLSERDKGTPHASAISPVLANLFMHFAFDRWMARELPGCPFERYADLCGCPHRSAYPIGTGEPAIV
jgi:RNA-directed DNA polymerase